MTSLLDRRFTAASDDSVCRWHAAKLWQTRAKLLKLNLICIISCTTSKNVLKFALLIFFFKPYKLSSAGKRTARFLLAGACVSYVACVHCVACVALDENPASPCISYVLAVDIRRPSRRRRRRVCRRSVVNWSPSTMPIVVRNAVAPFTLRRRSKRSDASGTDSASSAVRKRQN